MRRLSDKVYDPRSLTGEPVWTGILLTFGKVKIILIEMWSYEMGVYQGYGVKANLYITPNITKYRLSKSGILKSMETAQ